MSKRNLLTPESLRQNFNNLPLKWRGKYLALVGMGLSEKLYKCGQIGDCSPTQQKNYQHLLSLDKTYNELIKSRRD